MSDYTNMAGQRFVLRERPLEPADCWGGEAEQPVCQCAQCGQDIWPGEHAYSDGGKGKWCWCRECFQGVLSSEWKLPDIAEQLGYDVMLL